MVSLFWLNIQKSIFRLSMAFLSIVLSYFCHSIRKRTFSWVLLTHSVPIKSLKSGMLIGSQITIFVLSPTLEHLYDCDSSAQRNWRFAYGAHDE